MQQNQHWQQLLVYLNHNQPLTMALLSRPCPEVPPKELYRKIEHQIGGHRNFLARHLLSAVLRAEPAELPALPSWLDHLIQDCFSLPLATLTAGAWIHVPVLVVQNKSVRTLWFLLGELPAPIQDSPLFSVNCQDQQSSRALEESIGHLALIPLIDETEPPLQGRSMQLPLALGKELLARRQYWPKGLRATGAVHANQVIDMVGHLELKFQAAIEDGCHLILGPVVNHPSLKEDCRYFGCRNLREATLATHWYTASNLEKKFDLYFACLADAALCCDHLAELPDHFFDLPEFAQIGEEIRLRPKRLITRLTAALEDENIPAGKKDRLGRFIEPEVIIRIARDNPGKEPDCFSLCLAQMNVLNHLGRPDHCRPWQEAVETLYARMAASTDLGDYLNRRLVHNRFNRYDFCLDIPAELDQFIAEEEARNQAAHRDNRSLGAIYGTLAQLCGFCGPSNLDRLRAYLDLARKSFGRRYQQETLRLDNYLVYALLDAGETTEGDNVLRHYLGLDKTTPISGYLSTSLASDPEQKEGHTPYKIALACRFLAEMPEAHPLPELTVSSIMAHCKTSGHHPWQLTAYNLGRLLWQQEEQEQALQAMRLSIDICLANGPTMRPMALLGLAFLFQQARLDNGEREQVLRMRKWLDKEAPLSRAHFQPLLHVHSHTAILEEILHQPQRYFPFSYR